MTETELRPPPTRPLPELDAEQEVDVRHYWSRLALRWWLPLAGLVLGMALGYILSLGAGQVYRAEALLYLGQPFSPTGNAPVQGLATNASTVDRIARSESALKEAARESGMPLSQLRGGVSTQTITGARGLLRAGQTPLVELSVTGEGRGRVARAANALAERVVERVSVYPDVKIDTYERQLTGVNRELSSLDRRIQRLSRTIDSGGLSQLDQLVLISQLDNAEQRRADALAEQLEVQQLLALAKEVERSRVVEPATANKTTARSVRNSILVGGLLGLILGAIAALLWDPVARRLNTRPA
jgi:hypothetical protein